MAVKNIKPYEIGDKLTPKQERWIEEYIKCDDYTTASRNAGYGGNNLRSIGYENSIKFKKILDNRRKEISETIKSESIAELEEIFQFWTSVFKDPEEMSKNRLRASELLAKAKGAFVEKVEVKPVESDWFK